MKKIDADLFGRLMMELDSENHTHEIIRHLLIGEHQDSLSNLESLKSFLERRVRHIEGLINQREGRNYSEPARRLRRK